ncbi:MAG: hypothetical protein JNK25_00575 [Phycisphaerae bacterium]|nr:hypothetical protein [Phycisphaerae bacterium]
MAWTIQRKVFGGILAVAGAALIADRTLTGNSTIGPDTAAAAADTTPIKAAASAPSAPAAAQGPTLVDRLESLREQASDSDPFASPFVTEVVIAPAAPETPVTPAIDTTAWTAKHKLTAVLKGRNGAVAMIGGQVYRIGDQLDGLTLTSIENQTARFEGPGTAAELSVRSAEAR